METRKKSESKPSPLPDDYLKMVKEVTEAHFEAALKIYRQFRPETSLVVSGAICSNEVWLSLSLVTPGILTGATVYASCDFDPKASSPGAADLLSTCVDTLGSVLGNWLDETNPNKIELLAEDSARILEEMPLNWTPVETHQREVFIRFDRANPVIEDLASEWLKKHDPELAQLEEETEEEVKKLFVTGPKAAGHS